MKTGENNGTHGGEIRLAKLYHTIGAPFQVKNDAPTLLHSIQQPLDDPGKDFSKLLLTILVVFSFKALKENDNWSCIFPRGHYTSVHA